MARRKLYNPADLRSITRAAKAMSIEHNVTFRVIDERTGRIVRQHEGHNAATNSMLTGIAHYLTGDGILNQAYSMLSDWVPRYISLGTMGLFTQADDDEGLPVGLGAETDTLSEYDTYGNVLYYGDPETERLCHYIAQCPGFGADGYDNNLNNERPYMGLGPVYESRSSTETVYCELITDSYPRAEISYRDIVAEYEAEIPKTIDIIFSAMVSTGALKQFRGYNDDLTQKTYLFITEAGLWSSKTWEDSGDNGLLAGYRIIPPNYDNWNMGTYVDGYYADDGETWIPSHYELGLDPDNNYEYSEELAQQQLENQKILKSSILRVEQNQVVQVIWKVQLGGLEQLGGLSALYPSLESGLVWTLWDQL